MLSEGKCHILLLFILENVSVCVCLSVGVGVCVCMCVKNIYIQAALQVCQVNMNTSDNKLYL